MAYPVKRHYHVVPVKIIPGTEDAQSIKRHLIEMRKLPHKLLSPKTSLAQRGLGLERKQGAIRLRLRLAFSSFSF